MAQVGPRLRLGRVRPEEKGEALPRLRRVPVREEVRQERRGARGLKRRQNLATAADFEIAQEPDAERR